MARARTRRGAPDPVVVVEISPVRVAPRKAEHDYSPIQSVDGSPPPVLLPTDSSEPLSFGHARHFAEAAPAKHEPPTPGESLPPATEWSDRERQALSNLLAKRPTLTIQWSLIARALSRETSVERSAAECEALYGDQLAREYTSRSGTATKKPVSGVATPVDTFNARDPTRKFKMTKLLNDKTFRAHPVPLICSQSPVRAKRYSFLNDTLATDLHCPAAQAPDRKSAASLLNDVLPERTRPSLKLDDDRFVQKLKAATRARGPPVAEPRSQSAGTAPASRRRLQPRTLDKLVSEMTSSTDENNAQCVTMQGLQEELVALAHGEEEYALVVNELENLDAAAALID